MSRFGFRMGELLVVSALLCPGCERAASKPDTGADAEPERDAGGGLDALPDGKPDAFAVVVREAGTESSPDTTNWVSPEAGNDVPVEARGGTFREAGTEAGREGVAETGGETRAEAGSDTAAEVGREVAAEAGTEAGGDVRSAAETGIPVYRGRPQPMCVWNQAYQENYAPDTVAEILTGARDCYVLIDPFSSPDARSAIAQMRQGGNLVSCYISVGTCEDWRDDFAALKPYCVSKQWGDWPGEYFVDRTAPALVDLMKARIDKMTAWGCGMVEFDNMDWTFDPTYRSQYGITATAAEGEAYNEALCAYVHASGMGCMAKSSAQGAADFDGLTVESTPEDKDWWEEADMQGMLSSGKIGIVVHYSESDCATVRATYQSKYTSKLSFICEDKALKKYRHFP